MMLVALNAGMKTNHWLLPTVPVTYLRVTCDKTYKSNPIVSLMSGDCNVNVSKMSENVNTQYRSGKKKKRKVETEGSSAHSE